jgi:SNF2 family DNA or RNA helicase
MIVTFWKGLFVVDVLDEKGALKKAGFELHEPTTCGGAPGCRPCKSGVGRRFWSASIEAATRLKPYCNDAALRVLREHLARLAKSKATDTNLIIPCPPDLKFKGYQKAGIAYAVDRKDTLIADDMGLGKTVQALGFINYVKPRLVIVVAYPTLLLNWLKEAERWLTTPYNITIPKTKSDVYDFSSGNQMVITNYQKLIGDSRLSNLLHDIQWDVAIYDECQALKNDKSQQSIAVLGQGGIYHNTRRNLFLSGTPIENRPREIWPIAAAISPAKFGDWWGFAARYCGLHKEAVRGWVADGATHLEELQQKLRATFMVRRLKSQVLKELPPKLRQLVVLSRGDVGGVGKTDFQNWRKKYGERWDESVAAFEIAQTEAQYKEAALSMEKVAGIAFEEMSKARHEMALAKLPLCLAYAKEVIEQSTNGVIIFAHHTDVILAAYEAFRGDAVLLHGGTKAKDRQKAVDDFQSGKKKVFIGQTRVAGTGITLTAADKVIFFEVDWVPGVVTQCEDRACRIGQQKMVHVMHLVEEDTLDANMVQMILAKQKIIERALDNLSTPALRKRKVVEAGSRQES